ncbi:hypothetical protein [Salinibacterium sp.]|uniref:hypothetical protein n=1 Tax=Salinibacterium sp. TaxID=1915057 RepID=UPI00286D4183|nr:hypothetical protein [Salinibacterium sp.]
MNRIARELFTGNVVAISQRRKDLGETMVIIHARRQQELGNDVIVLIDDGPGQRRAKVAGLRTVIDTQAILIKCAKIGTIADRAAMKVIYDRLRQLDDGLPPWAAARLALRDQATYGSDIQ